MHETVSDGGDEMPFETSLPTRRCTVKAVPQKWKGRFCYEKAEEAVGQRDLEASQRAWMTWR